MTPSAQSIQVAAAEWERLNSIADHYSVIAQERDRYREALDGVIAYCEENRAYCWPPELADATSEEINEKRGPCAAYGAVVYGNVIDVARRLRGD